VEAIEVRHALAVIARVLNESERTHPPEAANNWLRLSVRDHIGRAINHATKALMGVADDGDDLANAACRLLLALERRERERATLQRLRERTEERRAR